MAVQLRDAVVERFPEVKVFLKPIDPHAPRNRSRTGAFEVQMCFHSRFTSNHHKVLLFSKLQRGDFPDTRDLLHQLSELQANPPAGGASSWDPFEPKTKVDFAFDPESFAMHGADPYLNPPDPEKEEAEEQEDQHGLVHNPEYNEILKEEQIEMGRGEQLEPVRTPAALPDYDLSILCNDPPTLTGEHAYAMLVSLRRNTKCRKLRHRNQHHLRLRLRETMRSQRSTAAMWL